MPTWRIDGTHIITSTRLIAPTSTPGLGSPLPHLRRDPAHHCDVFAGICLIPTTAHCCHHCTGLGHSCDICSVTRLAAATFAPRLGSPLPHLHLDWAHCHTCTGAGLAAGTSLPGLGSLLPHMCQTRPNAGLITQCCLRVSDHPSRCQRCGLDQISPELACGEICQVAHICQRPRHVRP